MNKSSFPFITIVMPVHNEERYIALTLEDILKQDYPEDRFEIIVADGASADHTCKIVEEFAEKNPQVTLMPNPGRLASSGRNVGFKNGKGDIFLVIDGHCRIDNRRHFQEIITCFEKSGAHCLGRPQPLNPPDISEFQQAVALARSSKIGHSLDSFIYSNYEGFVSPVSHGAIYKKEVFDKVGYLDETFDACEDVEFNYRIEKSGLKTYMSPSLAVQYYPRKNLVNLFRQMVRYGIGRFRFLKKHPEAFLIQTITPSLFVLSLPLSLVLGLLKPSLWWVFWSIYLAYFIVTVLASLHISSKSGFRYFRHLVPIFHVIHFGLGWGCLKGLLKKKWVG